MAHVVMAVSTADQCTVSVGDDARLTRRRDERGQCQSGSEISILHAILVVACVVVRGVACEL